MTSLDNAGDANSWNLVFNENFAVEYRQGKHIPIFTPIPRQKLNFAIKSSFFAICSMSDEYPNSRKYLGYVAQLIKSPSNLSAPISIGKHTALYANECVLIEFPVLNSEYELMLVPKFETKEITLNIFEYQG